MDRIQMLCQECTREPAYCRCGECEQHLCVECDGVLHSGGKRRLHERIMVCEECENRDSKLFCQNCEQFLCPECDRRIHNKGTRRTHTRVTRNRLQPKEPTPPPPPPPPPPNAERTYPITLQTLNSRRTPRGRATTPPTPLEAF